jgi:hypothetical protein
VFSPAARTGLVQLPPDGGTTRVLTVPDAARGETSHRQPAVLPDARSVIFTAEGDTYARRSLVVVSVADGTRRELFQGDVLGAKYLPTGHLAYLQNNSLVVAAFDADRQAFTGPAVKVIDAVESFGFSMTGTLIYSATRANGVANARPSSLVWVNRTGVAEALPAPVGIYEHPRLSPDGRRIAAMVRAGADRSLWIYDIARDALTRLTFGASNNWPVWMRDSARLVYASNRPGTQWDIVSKPADGSGGEEKLLVRPFTQIPRVVSPEGDLLVYTETDPGSGDTLWRLSMADSPAVAPLFDKTPGEMMPSFSPDGHWIAYVSPESGRNEVYVRPRTGGAAKWQVSIGGGVEPLWAPKGHELFYRTGEKMMAVDVETSPNFSAGRPRVLFEDLYLLGTTEGQNYDISIDGRRFLMLKPQDGNTTSMPLNVVANWFDDVKRQVPALR